MKIKHYPGKAVANDPYLLDMEARNPAMDLLYEASWLDAQRSLSSSSSGSNSWDRHSTSSTERNPLKLYKYNRASENDKNKVSSKKNNVKSQKYHSDQYLSRIAPQRTKRVIEMDCSIQDDFSQNYYLPSQTKYINRQHSFRTIDDLPDLNQLSLERSKEHTVNNESYDDIDPSVRYRNVINDLEVQLVKKSVRFHEKSEEIGVQDASEESSNSDTENENHARCNNGEFTSSQDFKKISWDGNESEAVKQPTSNKRNSTESQRQKVRVHENPMDTEAFRKMYKSTTVKVLGDGIIVDINDDVKRKESDEIIAERVNEWINEQNQYIVDNTRTNSDINDSKCITNSKSAVKKCDEVGSNSSNYYDFIAPSTVPSFAPLPKPRTLTKYKKENDSDNENNINGIYISRIKPHDQTDEEFYEQLVNSRQRLPAAKNGFTEQYPTDTPDKHHYENEDVISNHAKTILEQNNDLSSINSLYKDSNRTSNSVIYSQKTVNTTDSQNGSDFLIPRPKLIVPVHTYAVRKRRTGNLQSRKSLTDTNLMESMDYSDGNLGEKHVYII